MRAAADEFLQIGKKYIFSHDGTGSNAKMGNSQTVPALQKLFGCIQGTDGFLHMTEKEGSVFCQGDAPGISFEKLCVQRLFQLLDGPAHGWLADIQLLGGPGDIAAFGGYVKNVIL